MLCYPQPRNESASLVRKPILPQMVIRRERTEIVSHKARAFITRLPSSVEVDLSVQSVFDAYRGTNYLSRDLPNRDDRFAQLTRILSPSAQTRSRELPPRENLTSQPINKKNGQQQESPVGKCGEARVLVASRGASRGGRGGGCAGGVEFVTRSESRCRPAEILHSCKTEDVKELAKSLVRESHIQPESICTGAEVKKSNVHFPTISQSSCVTSDQ